ncbi:glycosyltransferase family 2 protein [Brucella cytisi]|uniref:Glycosyltransferase 2-like domain-containing protein n=1 Tax=Brucella cytisi TaxID=407152 RepID=A0A1J6HSB1_9HYPH|nr:glycosyltransferase family 2 protein [Brucella cytisi]OIS91119.1 hypothetical protein BLA27_23290 [Brucella cytisi]
MKVRRPAVSVVIPHYNQHQYLERSVASVACQLDAMDEILIVDDNSSEAPIIKADAWIPTVRVLILPRNCGPGMARNIGVEQARHDYIAFLDADDIALSGRITAQLRALNANTDWAGCVGDFVYQRDEKKNSLATHQEQGFFEIRRKLLAGRIFAAGSTLMMKRQAFLNVGGYNPDLRVYEDWDLLIRMVFYSAVGHCGESIANISPSTRRSSKDDRLRVLRQFNERYAGLVEAKDYRRFMQALAYERASAYFHARQIWSGFLAAMAGFWYAPLIFSRRFAARIFKGLP